MKKKWCNIIIFIFLTFLFVACGVNNSQNQKETKEEIKEEIDKEITEEKIDATSQEAIKSDKETVKVKYYEETIGIPTADTFLGFETVIVLVSETDGEYTYSLGYDKEEAEEIFKVYMAMIMNKDFYSIEPTEDGSLYTINKDDKVIAVLGVCAKEDGEYMMILSFI